METKGYHVFSRNDNVCSPNKLGKVFKASHNTVSRKPIVNDDNLKTEQLLNPLRPTERTWLIHPSPVSEAALEFTRKSQTTAFSSYSANLFIHLAELKKAFTLFILADLLFTLEKTFPHLFPKPNSLLDPTAITICLSEYCKQLVSVLDDTSFIARIDKLTVDFDRTVTTYLAIGVVPVDCHTQNQPNLSTSPSCSNGYTVKTFVERYLSALETSLNIFKVLDDITIKADTILTARNGVYGCSNYHGQPYVLWTFDTRPAFFQTGYALRTPIMDMMQDEYQYIFANARHRHQTLEKMTKTSVVVSSSLTSEAEDLLESARKGPLKFNPVEVMQTVEKEGENIKLLNMKAEVVKAASSSTNLPASVDSPLSSKMEMDALEAALDINTILEKSLAKHFKRMKPVDSEEDETLLEGDKFIPCIVQQRGRIHGAGPENSQREEKERTRVVQEKLLFQKHQKLKLELKRLEAEGAVLRTELISYIQSNATINYRKRIQETNLQVTEKKLAEAIKECDRKTGTIEKLEKLMAGIKDSVKTILKETNAGEDERSRLLNLFMRNNADSDFAVDAKYEGGQRKRQLLDFFVAILGNQTLKRHDAKDEEDSNQNDEKAYEQMLNESGVYVAPFFTNVLNKANLDGRNYSLPFEWMYDRRLEMFDGHGDDTAIDLVGRQAVTNTPELYILDVNPRTATEQDKVKRAIEGTNGRTVLDSVFQRTFLNVQFPVQGNVEASINVPLKEKWHNLTKRLLLLSGETFTKNGQRVGARVSTDSIQYFIVPYVTQYLGQRGYTKRLPTLVASVLDTTTSTTEEDYESVACSLHEKLVYIFIKRKLGSCAL